ncbi:HD domain-containing phosphohydrolase [Coprothermobacter platensis]|uniref:HD domain-containing phosphohydrolase n=1 Tax=Coprothermobacter platensis TaxID=108819 RepID=UPI0012EAA93B|nr:transporter substrate-binding domain-containing protein [Coprothermobacter platensis]
MTRKAKVCLSITLLLFLIPVGAKADIVFSVHAYNPPFAYMQSGKLQGFSVDLAKEIGKVLKQKVDFLPTAYQSDAVDAVKQGKADAVLLMGFYENASTTLLPTDPYFYPYYVIVVKKDSSYSVDDLKQKTIAVVDGTTMETYLAMHNFKNIISFGNQQEVIDALESNRVNAAFMSEESYKYFVQNSNIKDTKTLPEKVQLAQYVIGVNPKNVVLQSQINQALLQLKSSGKYDELIKRWFATADLSSEFVSSLVRNVAIGVFFGVVAAALVFYWILRMLRLSKRELGAAYEQLAAENQQLTASYEEILNVNKELEDLRGKEKNLLSLMGQLRPDVEDETFYTYLLNLALNLVPEAQAGSILIMDDDGLVRFKALVGYSNLLETLDMQPEWIYHPTEVEVVQALNDSNMPPDVAAVFNSARPEPIAVSLAAPLLVNKQWYGSIFVDSFEEVEFSQQSLELFDSLSSLASAFTALKVHERTASKFLKEIILILVKALEFRDPSTAGHSERVAKIASDFASFIGYTGSNVEDIYWAGILHDIGKVGVADYVLKKPGSLTPEEYIEMKKHPVFSEEILSQSDTLKKYAKWVGAHHERWDGNGYPRGLSGEEIPIEGRILALADAFDAMSTDRPYRKGKSLNEAIDEIAKCGGTQFDPYLAAQFVHFLKRNYL